MANDVKRIYEGMFLLDSSVAAEDWDAALNAIKTVFDRAGAEPLNIRKWDECRLCYEIKGHRRGTYVLSFFKADSQSIAGIERDVQLSEVILRVLILRADYLSKDPAEAEAQMNAATPAVIAQETEAAAAERAATAAASAAEPVAEPASQDDQAAPEPATDSVEAPADQEPLTPPADQDEAAEEPKELQ